MFAEAPQSLEACLIGKSLRRSISSHHPEALGSVVTAAHHEIIDSLTDLGQSFWMSLDEASKKFLVLRRNAGAWRVPIERFPHFGQSVGLLVEDVSPQLYWNGLSQSCSPPNPSIPSNSYIRMS